MAEQGAAILSQIEGLLEQYLALGESTPFFQQATDMHDQLQQVLGHQGGPTADNVGYGLDANVPPGPGAGPESEGPSDLMPEPAGDVGPGDQPAAGDLSAVRGKAGNALKMMQAADAHIKAGTPQHQIPPQLLPYIKKKQQAKAGK